MYRYPINYKRRLQITFFLAGITFLIAERLEFFYQKSFHEIGSYVVRLIVIYISYSFTVKTFSQ